MNPIDTVTQQLARHLAADQSLVNESAKEAAAVSAAAANLDGQIASRVKTAQRLTSQIQGRKIAVAPFELPKPSAAAQGERFASSEMATDRLNATRGDLPRIEERIENDLAAIDGIRKARAKALRRLQLMAAATVILAVAFAAIVLDRLGKAQTAYDGALAALNRGDLAAFDRGIAEAGSFIPVYRAVEAASLRSAGQTRETQYRAVVAALQNKDYIAFDKELAALKALSPAYRQPDVERFEQIRATGTPRAGTKLTLRAPVILDIVFVPAGVFTMGSDPQKDRSSDSDERPQHPVTLGDYWIGRTEVTNDQYAVYARAKGLSFSVPTGKGSHPVVNVSWNDAQGFVAWLSEQTGLSVRLPSEEEWEKACRGTDGRLFPWGDSFDKARLNSSEGGGRDTTPAGAYSPGGDSPYGAADMAGNVWEWTASKYTSDYQPGTRTETNGLVLRGGGFYYYLRTYARCADRDWFVPGFRFNDFGFRVVVSPFF